MRARFGAGEKTRSQHSGLRAQRERCDNAATVGNTTGSSNDVWRHCIDYSRHQRKRRNLSGNVTTGLHTLRDYYIDIRLCRALRVRDRTDLMENFAAASVNAIDIWWLISPEKRNDRHTLRHTNRDPFIDRKM